MEEARKYKIDMRLLRVRAKLTLKQVAEHIGTTQQSMSDWELGMTDLKLRIEQVEKLVELYDVTITELAEAWRQTERQPNRKDARVMASKTHTP